MDQNTIQNNISTDIKDEEIKKDTTNANTVVDNSSDGFDEAFNKASQVVKDYIMNDKFEENIKIICKINKFEGEKENIAIENTAISILIGIYNFEQAKNSLIQSFKDANIAVDNETISNIIKNIDTYILSGIRKEVSKEKNNSTREIKHMTLKEANYEKEKEELRKILLERTGTLTGKGEALIQYKNRDSIKEEEGIKEEESKKEKEIKSIKSSIVNRDSLLAKANIKDLDDVGKIKERMMQIKAEEDARLLKLQAEEKAKEDLRQKRKELEEKRKIEMETFNKENEIALVEDQVKEEESQNISKLLAQELKERIENNTDDEVDLNALREKRAREEEVLQKKKAMSYSNNISSENNTVDEAFDPYRENM